MFVIISNSPALEVKGILTKLEKEYLKGKKPLNTRAKSRLIHNLNERFLELFKDLEIIRRSKVLHVWRATKLEPRGDFTGADVNLLKQVFSGVTEVHLSVIQREKKGKKYVYWLDHRPIYDYNIRYDDRSLKPEYVLRGLSTRVKEQFGKQLVEAYNKSKISDEKHKKTLEQILKLIRH